MKRLLFIIVSVLLIIQGCSSSPSHLTVANGTNGEPTQKPDNCRNFKGNETPGDYIDSAGVEWITMQGGLNVTTRVLFSGNDDKKITGILKLINSGTGMRSSTDEEIHAINSKVRPIGISIKMKDGSRSFIWPSYKFITRQNISSAFPSEDKIILQLQKDSKDQYYTLCSNEAAHYLLNDWKNDMPPVDVLKVESDTIFRKDNSLIIRNGDSIILSGDGCTEKEVSIYLCKNGENSIRYLLGSATPSLGKWEWTGIASRFFRTLDGKDIQLDDGLYDIVVSTHSSERSVSSIVEMKKGFYKEFGAKDLVAGSFPGAVFIRNDSLYIYNENKNEIKALYSSPALTNLVGLSADKKKIAFLCQAAGEHVIGVFDRDKGKTMYIPVENRYAYQNTFAWWHNDRVIMASGHVNPSAGGFVSYDAATGKELSSGCGQLMATASDGRFILFRLTPHWMQNPPPDNIYSSNDDIKPLYLVRNPKDKIIFTKISADNRKLSFIETLSNNANIRVNIADLNTGGTALSNFRKKVIDTKDGKLYSAFVTEDFARAMLVIGKNNGCCWLTEVDLNNSAGMKASADTIQLGKWKGSTKEVHITMRNGTLYLVRLLDKGKKNVENGHDILSMQIYAPSKDSTKIVHTVDEIDVDKVSEEENKFFNEEIDPERIKALTKAASGFFQDAGSIEEMGISKVEWFW